MIEEQQYSPSSRITRAYILSFLLIAFFALCGWWLVEYLLSNTAHDSTVINIAGRQRMLSQSITKNIVLLSQNAENNFLITNELATNTKQFRKAHQLLTQDMPHSSAEIRDLFRQLESNYQVISKCAEQSIQNPKQAGQVLQKISQAEKPFLRTMDLITNQFERDNKIKLEKLERIELLLLVITLVTIAFEVGYVFYPLTKKLDIYWREIILSNHKLNSINTELEEMTNAQKEMEVYIENTLLQLQAVLDSATETLIISTNLRGEIIFFNKGAEKILGYEAEEIIRKQTPLFFHDTKEVAIYRRELETEFDKTLTALDTLTFKAKQGVPESRTWTYKAKGGRNVLVRANITCIYNAQGRLTGFLWSGSDITDDHKTNIALEAQQKLISAITETMPDILYVFDIQTKSAIYINQEVKNILGYEPKDILEMGSAMTETIIYSQDLYLMLKHYRLLGKNRHINTRGFNVRAVHKKGDVIWLHLRSAVFSKDVNGNVTQIICIAQDISEMQWAAERLAEREQQYRLALSAANDGIWDYNLKTRELYFSPRWKEMLGYTESEFPNTYEACFAALLPEDAEFAIQTLTDFLKGNSPDFKIITRFRHKDGSVLHILARAIAIRDESGRTIRAIGANTDITEVKRTEEALIKAKEEALQLAKAKQMFLSTMSHEMRTPMNAVIGITHLLQQENPQPNQIENLKTLRFAAENLLVIINDILDFSKIEAGKITFDSSPFNIHELILGIKKSFDYQANAKGIELNYLIDPMIPPMLLGDSVRLGQVITNLVGNAIKFTQEGAVNMLLTCQNKTDDTINIEFAISDTGIGIAADQLDHIFDSFTQASSDTTRKFGGTGLGLAITRRLLQLQHSDILVTSELGAGSVFSFKLTFSVHHQKENEANTPNTEIEIPLEGLQILLVEDNEVNRMIAIKFLSRWGVQTDSAENGMIGVEKAQQKKYDIILMDLQMPEMDGIEATQHIRQDANCPNQQTPIIALSAASIDEIAEQVQSSAMNDYISKPFNPKDLRSKITLYAQIAMTKNVINTERLTEFSVGNPQFVKQLQKLYFDTFSEFEQKLSAVVAEKDAKQIRFMAHKIKPSVKMLQIEGFEELEEALANAIEQNPDSELVEQKHKELCTLCQKVVQELKESL
ncbi:PAS domain S-box-containing protein [Flexibacter flexilis DSM 6793]|uniref:histidine kinase n=1 Tax=Flexibacter flexilis DSM 6793 TaxID=927664 RepID=A0A1I1DAG3_9BACT|nr:PAS domain S-box protein [Flexibacter flexilis]SFB71804.1 PAS domain S-box-containing protein [Flexibacter flexilis DSM 6793]